MSDTPESPTIRLLQDMRAEMRETRTEIRELRAEMRQGFESLNDRLDDTNTRLEGMACILTLLAGHIGQQGERKLEGGPGDGGG